MIRPRNNPFIQIHQVPRLSIICRNSSSSHDRDGVFIAHTDSDLSLLLPRDVSARFGLRLRQLRRERALTQTRMAAVFGIDRSFISDVERGRKSISLPTLEIIALGLNMTLSELLKDV